MYEVDFLPVESPGQSSSKCGDAIAVNFTYAAEQRQAVIVIDGGYTDTGSDLAEHIWQYYDTDVVDLVVSTHPDADHLNGLRTLLSDMTVRQLMVHQPRNHVMNVADFSNIEAVDELLALAAKNNVPVIEPFQGVQAFNGQFTVLGPTQEYYVDLVRQHLEEERTGAAALRRSASSRGITLARRMLDKVVSLMPVETLTNDGETGPRNNTSVISLLEVDGHRFLFTGDAGIPALELAADYYEYYQVGLFAAHPLTLFQVPHHGSKHNVGPDILDRMLGPRGGGHDAFSAIISSAKACEDHPSSKVVNAVSRRGGQVVATEGRTVCSHDGTNWRPGWSPITPIGPLDESD